MTPDFDKNLVSYVSTCMQIMVEIRICFADLWPKTCFANFSGQLLTGPTIRKPGYMGSEDCLYLNAFAPSKRSNALLIDFNSSLFSLSAIFVDNILKLSLIACIAA